MPKGINMVGAAIAVAGAIIAACAPAHASSAGDTVSNTASIQYSQNGASRTQSSNAALFRIAELLDITLAGGGIVALSPGKRIGVPFTLTNSGNGNEAFLLSGDIDGVAGAIDGFAIDVDGDGRFDPAIDTVLAAGAATPVLASGAGLRLLALVGATVTGGDMLNIAARARTGSGTPGSSFNGMGDDGGDAVVGNTSATADLSVRLTVAAGSDPGRVTLTKSQSVAGRNGSTEPALHAIVTYSIEARFTGDGTTRDARLSDAIPTGTDYVPGSLSIDGAALSDADDSDTGSFDGSAIRVAIGTVTGPAVRTVQFKVKIK